ncbi:MAG: glycosyl hydrolase family 18 protein [Acidobacteriota bacterium]
MRVLPVVTSVVVVLLGCRVAAQGALPSSATSAPYAVSGWSLGDGDSLNRAAQCRAIDEIDLDWFTSQKNGTVVQGYDDPALVAAARAAGLLVMATVSNWSEGKNGFDPAVPRAILRGPRKMRRHAADLAALCDSLGYDGIDLDWESLKAKERDRFSDFVEELAADLHAEGKGLAIAVHPKTSEPGDWSGAKAEDWLRLGAAVDEFKVMTYDYSGPWSPPGPIAPPDWIDAVLTFAQSEVPPEKIMMGLPFYGYDWSAGSAIGLDWADVQSLIAQYAPTVTRDPSGEETFTYTDAMGIVHTVFYQDGQSLEEKIQVLTGKHPDIRGIAIWVLEREDPSFWGLIDGLLRPGDSCPQTPAVRRAPASVVPDHSRTLQ